MRYRPTSSSSSSFLRPAVPPPTLHQPMYHISRQQIADVFSSQEQGRKPLSVCFTGHRILSSQERTHLSGLLDCVLEALYCRGYRDFLCGGALGFDTLAAQRVLCLRQAHPDVRLCMALPCSNQSARWRPEDCRVYEQLLYAADETTVLSRDYYDGCMFARNRYMVDHSSFCVCYLHHRRGGTLQTSMYALHEGLPLLNLAMQSDCDAFLQKKQ